MSTDTNNKQSPRNTILEYIRHYPGCLRADVIRYSGSRNWALLKSLIKDGVVVAKPGAGRWTGCDGLFLCDDPFLLDL